MTILITPRLTLRPPIDWDLDDIAEIAGGAEAAAGILPRAAFVILRERAIGWVDGTGGVTLGARWRGFGYEAEAAGAAEAAPPGDVSRNRGERPAVLLKSAAIQPPAPA